MNHPMRSSPILPRWALAAALFLGSQTASMAQVVATVGPQNSPSGGTVWISVSNDTTASIFLASPCPFVVRDAVGAVVYGPVCAAVLQPVAAGGVYTTVWNQQNFLGNQVPPGNYSIEVTLPGGPSVQSVNIATSEDMGTAQLGAIKIGRTRQLGVTAPADGGFLFVTAAAFTPGPAILTCGGIVPLAPDALLTLSLTPGNGFMNGNTGTLSPTGDSTAPSITLPNLPSLIGLSFWVASVAVDPLAACNVRSITQAMFVTVI